VVQMRHQVHKVSSIKRTPMSNITVCTISCLNRGRVSNWLVGNQLRLIRCHVVLTLFSVEHTNALDRAVVGNPLAEPPSTGRSNRLGGRSNRLGQEARRKPRFAAPGGTPSGTVCLGLS
jgi:hypothetical protein